MGKNKRFRFTVAAIPGKKGAAHKVSVVFTELPVVPLGRIKVFEFKEVKEASRGEG